MKVCEWCGEFEVVSGRNMVYWEFFDGIRVIELIDIFVMVCVFCGMIY